MQCFCRRAGCVAPAFLAVFCVLEASALTVRAKSDLRLWETVADRSVPLEWAWDDAADSAQLVFSNRLTHAVIETSVERGDGEMRGSCAQPEVDADDETIFDMTLVQMSGGAVTNEASAVLAYVLGAGGGPITVQVRGTAEWKRRKTPRVYGFDPEWYAQTGDSGYRIADPYDPATRITIR